MLLAGSRRWGGCSCRRVGLRPRLGLGQMPAYPHLPLSSHEAAPQHREPLPYLCDWDNGAGGWEKKRKPAKRPAKMPKCPSPSRMRRKMKRGKVRRRLTLLYTPYYALSDCRSPVISPLSPSSHSPPQATNFNNWG